MNTTVFGYFPVEWVVLKNTDASGLHKSHLFAVIHQNSDSCLLTSRFLDHVFYKRKRRVVTQISIKSRPVVIIDRQ